MPSWDCIGPPRFAGRGTVFRYSTIALISGASNPYLNPGIFPFEPFAINSRIVSSFPSTSSLYNTGPYLRAPGVDSVWQMAQRCWNTRRPSICVSFKVKVTDEFVLPCWAGTASENANSKKIRAPLLIRAPYHTVHKCEFIRVLRGTVTRNL